MSGGAPSRLPAVKTFNRWYETRHGEIADDAGPGQSLIERRPDPLGGELPP